MADASFNACRVRSQDGLGHIPSLDGLRGIAVLWVVLHHAGLGLGRGWTESSVQTFYDVGWAGVDLFFALSGFLITRILIETRDRPDYFARFYWRRTKRIFPLYFAVLGLAFCCCPGWWVGRFATYSANLLPGDWYYGEISLGHFWSLCVEEHFYLFWPAVVKLIPLRRLPLVIAFTAGFSVLLRAFMMDFGWHFDEVLKFTPCRLDGLALGAGLAVWRLPRPGLVALVAGAVAVGLGWTCNHNGTLFVSVGRFAVSIAAVGGVAWSVEASPKFLSDPWLRRLGELSYGVYVWHYLFAGILTPVSSEMFRNLGYWGGSFMSIAVWLGTGLVLAILSERFIERPFRNLP